MISLLLTGLSINIESLTSLREDIMPRISYILHSWGTDLFALIKLNYRLLGLGRELKGQNFLLAFDPQSNEESASSWLRLAFPIALGRGTFHLND